MERQTWLYTCEHVNVVLRRSSRSWNLGCGYYACPKSKPGTIDRGCGYFEWLDFPPKPSTPQSHSPGPSSRPSQSSGPSSRTSHSLGLLHDQVILRVFFHDQVILRKLLHVTARI